MTNSRALSFAAGFGGGLLAGQALTRERVQFARLAGSSIVTPPAAGWVTDFLNAAYYRRAAGERRVDDLRLAASIVTSFWWHRGGTLLAGSARARRGRGRSDAAAGRAGRPVQPLVELLDAGELELLALGEVAWVLPEREPGALELFGELLLALAASLVPDLAADLVERGRAQTRSSRARGPDRAGRRGRVAPKAARSGAVQDVADPRPDTDALRSAHSELGELRGGSHKVTIDEAERGFPRTSESRVAFPLIVVGSALQIGGVAIS